jgi:hypothetical protein
MSKHSAGKLVLLPIFLFLLCLIACRTARKTPKPIVIRESHYLTERSAEELLALIHQHRFDAQWLGAKGEAEIRMDDRKEAFDITLRMRKDSLIWISVSPLLGLETMRILITPDSVKLLNRLTREYLASPLDFLNNRLRMNVDFDILQNLLTGNIFAYKKNKFNSVYNNEDGYYILSTLSKHKMKRALEEKDPNKPVVQDIWINNENFRIVKHSIEDERLDKVLITQYHQFKTTAAGEFPRESTTHLKAEQEFTMTISFKKVIVNEPLQFPFSIPASYKPMD